MSQPQFLIDFQQKMDKLNNVKRNMQASIQFKEQFTNDIKSQLGAINQKLQELARLIDNLKKKSDSLESQISSNSSSITGKEKQLQDLQQQINSLNQEKATLAKHLDDERSQAQQQSQTQQSKIDQYESQLREITDKYNTQTAQVAALEGQLKDSGDKNATAAEQINQLTQASQKQLQEQAEQLNQKITECENKINGFEKQLQAKEAEVQKLQQDINNHQGQAQNQSQSLQKEIDDLKIENQKLIQELNTATKAIDQAADDLQSLINGVPNAQTKQEIDALVQGIQKQIDDLIQNIGRNTQTPQSEMATSPIATAIPKQNQPNRPVLPLETQISLSDLGSGTATPVEIQLGALIGMLRTKSAQLSKRGNITENKYQKALNRIMNATSPDEVKSILSAEGVIIKNKQVFGGKKTKKNKKQKGGFIYKSTFKRRQLSPRTTTRSKRRSTR